MKTLVLKSNVFKMHLNLKHTNNPPNALVKLLIYALKNALVLSNKLFYYGKAYQNALFLQDIPTP